MNDAERDTSAFMGHEPCPKCGSRDNLARYASGRGFCHGCKHAEFPEDYAGGGAKDAPKAPRGTFRPFEPYEGTLGDERFTKAYGVATATRKATGISMVKKGVKFLGEHHPEKNCVTFDYRLPGGELWGQKIRYKLPEDHEKDKTFLFPHVKEAHPYADGKASPLWLMHKWGKGSDKRGIVIWEGEGDCAAYYEVTEGKYPTVSLPNGASGAVETMKAWYEWLNAFETIVLCFDGDGPGREWAEKAAAVLPPGRVKIGEVQGYKDAREALLAGDAKAITKAFWNAEPFKPQGIFHVRDLIAEARKPVQMGIPWFLDTLTKWTYGRRYGELYTLGAGNSIGKTDWTTQSIAYDALTLGIMTGVIFLEQPPVETLKRLAGKQAGKPFHIPMEALDEADRYTQAELDAALDALESSPNLVFGGNFASTDWPEVESKIRYLVQAHGVKIIYLDNLTALVDETNERASVEGIIKAMALLCQELKIIIVLLCHLATPDGKSHEEGGQVSLKHFKGSRAMGAWPHFALGIERNTQHPDPDMRHYSILRCVKDRYTGRANGNTLCLRFVKDTGQLVECEIPEGLFSAPSDERRGGRVPDFAPWEEDGSYTA
jgi:twinkle protein